RDRPPRPTTLGKGGLRRSGSCRTVGQGARADPNASHVAGAWSSGIHGPSAAAAILRRMDRAVADPRVGDRRRLWGTPRRGGGRIGSARGGGLGGRRAAIDLNRF